MNFYYRDSHGNEKWNIFCLSKIREKFLDGSPNIFTKYGLFLTVYLDDIKMASKQDKLSNIWAILKKTVDLEEPAPLIDQVYFGNTQRKSKVNNGIVIEK